MKRMEPAAAWVGLAKAAVFARDVLRGHTLPKLCALQTSQDPKAVALAEEIRIDLCGITDTLRLALKGRGRYGARG